MRLARLALAALAVLPPSAAAQEMDHSAHMKGGGIAAIAPLYERLRGQFITTVEAMPEEHFGFRPVPEVRSFAQIVGHVANENFLFCAAAKGEPDPNATDFEKTAAKAAMLKALRESFAYCDAAYAMPEMKAMEETSLFGSKGSRLWVLNFNVLHDGEHYGNLVTYLRLKGIVPPASLPGR